MSTTSRSWTIRSGEDFGRAIAGVRAARGLTQQALADRTMIDRSYLAKLETAALPSLHLERVLLSLRRMGALVTVTLPYDDGTPG